MPTLEALIVDCDGVLADCQPSVPQRQLILSRPAALSLDMLVTLVSRES